MPNVKLILAFCVLSGFLGLTLPNHKAAAADPAACDQYRCKNVAYWWEGDATRIKAAAAPGKDVPSYQAIQSIYTKGSNYDLPVSKTGFLIDIRTYPACTPMCGKDAKGVWQAYQEVDMAGKSILLMEKQDQYTCKILAKDKSGPKQAPQINGNSKNKNKPPMLTPSDDSQSVSTGTCPPPTCPSPPTCPPPMNPPPACPPPMNPPPM